MDFSLFLEDPEYESDPDLNNLIEEVALDKIRKRVGRMGEEMEISWKMVVLEVSGRYPSRRYRVAFWWCLTNSLDRRAELFFIKLSQCCQRIIIGISSEPSSTTFSEVIIIREKDESGRSQQEISMSKKSKNRRFGLEPAIERVPKEFKTESKSKPTFELDTYFKSTFEVGSSSKSTFEAGSSSIVKSKEPFDENCTGFPSPPGFCQGNLHHNIVPSSFQQHGEQDGSPFILNCKEPFDENCTGFQILPGFCRSNVHYNIVPSSFQIQQDVEQDGVYFHIPRIKDKKLLCVKPYTMTLADWLRENPEHRSRWSYKWLDKVDSYNLDWFRKMNEAGKRNLKRPQQHTCQIIRGLIVAVLELHEQGTCHRFLIKPKNILLRFQEQFFGAQRMETVQVSLTHDDDDGRVMDQSTADKDFDKGLEMENDISGLDYIIFKCILKEESLPCEWNHLKKMMSEFKKATKQCDTHYLQLGKKLKNHPCFWPWKQRFYFFELLWMRIVCWYKSYSNNNIDLDVLEPDMDVRSLIEKGFNLHPIRWKRWKDDIAIDTPLKEIAKSQNFSNDAIGLLRFLRIVNFHLHEKNGDGEDWKYIKPSDVNIYQSMEFVETMESVCFPLFLVELYFVLHDGSFWL